MMSWVVVLWVVLLPTTVLCAYPEHSNKQDKVKISKKNVAKETERRMLLKHHLASEMKVSGKKLIVKVIFNHNKSTDLIHDPEITKLAKEAGLKRVEFHDWSGFAKGYISNDIK